MFDNLGTALIQAFGFFSVFGYFVYKILFADKNLIDSQIKSNKKIISDTKPITKKVERKGFFNKRKNLDQEVVPPQKKGIFNRKQEIIQKDGKVKKKGWFK